MKLILPSSLPEQKLVSLQNHLHHFVCTSWFIRLKWELRTNNPKWQYPKIFDSRRIGILFDPDVDFSDQNRWQSWPITGWTGFLSLAASNETNGTEIWILVIQIILELLRPLIQFSKISGVFNVIWQNVGWSTGEQIYTEVEWRILEESFKSSATKFPQVVFLQWIFTGSCTFSILVIYKVSKRRKICSTKIDLVECMLNR